MFKIPQPNVYSKLSHVKGQGLSYADPENVSHEKSQHSELENLRRQKKANLLKPVEKRTQIPDDARLHPNFEYDVDTKNRRPLNPAGRTGMTGRGFLGKWGANYAADPIVTRYHPATGVLQVAAIKRRDTGAWGLPGGMVDREDPNLSATCKREFSEETQNFSQEAGQSDSEYKEKKGHLASLVDDLWHHEHEVYKGYTDDPRNTDNAWTVTTAMHYHCTTALAGSDDAQKARWMNLVDEENKDFHAGKDVYEKRYKDFYGGHKRMVEMAIQKAEQRIVESPILAGFVGATDGTTNIFKLPRKIDPKQAAFYNAAISGDVPDELLKQYAVEKEFRSNKAHGKVWTFRNIASSEGNEHFGELTEVDGGDSKTFVTKEELMTDYQPVVATPVVAEVHVNAGDGNGPVTLKIVPAVGHQAGTNDDRKIEKIGDTAEEVGGASNIAWNWKEEMQANGVPRVGIDMKHIPEATEGERVKIKLHPEAGVAKLAAKINAST